MRSSPPRPSRSRRQPSSHPGHAASSCRGVGRAMDVGLCCVNTVGQEPAFSCRPPSGYEPSSAAISSSTLRLRLGLRLRLRLGLRLRLRLGLELGLRDSRLSSYLHASATSARHVGPRLAQVLLWRLNRWYYAEASPTSHRLRIRLRLRLGRDTKARLEPMW